ncbi:unnamed protein product [Cuscuta europaea]|uniref:Uncharacterized protein n=1 Tax=Cuscuta europaea TaxID=41803 RepID=A0A9P0ZUZ2_CUSEU|nr:unnamed protein product [Cuscuta europaea]
MRPSLGTTARSRVPLPQNFRKIKAYLINWSNGLIISKKSRPTELLFKERLIPKTMAIKHRLISVQWEKPRNCTKLNMYVARLPAKSSGEAIMRNSEGKFRVFLLQCFLSFRSRTQSYPYRG